MCENTVLSLQFNASVLSRWDAVGRSRQLTSPTQIALFLLHCYEKTLTWAEKAGLLCDWCSSLDIFCCSSCGGSASQDPTQRPWPFDRSAHGPGHLAIQTEEQPAPQTGIPASVSPIPLGSPSSSCGERCPEYSQDATQLQPTQYTGHCVTPSDSVASPQVAGSPHHHCYESGTTGRDDFSSMVAYSLVTVSSKPVVSTNCLKSISTSNDVPSSATSNPKCLRYGGCRQVSAMGSTQDENCPEASDTETSIKSENCPNANDTETDSIQSENCLNATNCDTDNIRRNNPRTTTVPLPEPSPSNMSPVSSMSQHATSFIPKDCSSLDHGFEDLSHQTFSEKVFQPSDGLFQPLPSTNEASGMADPNYSDKISQQTGALLAQSFNENKTSVLLQCQQCSASFSQSARLKRHMKRHTPKRPFSCHVCQSTFTQGSELKVHLRTHTGQKPYSCATCGQRFSQSSHLKDHVRSHAGVKRFLCQQCGVTFARSHGLKVHMRRHSGEKPFACVQCGKAFVRAEYLQAHLRSHRGEKSFLCQQCGASFSSLSGLAHHVRAHSLDTSHDCRVCGSKFAMLSQLVSHNSDQHAADFPHQCHLCGSVFAHATSLTVHKRSHTGERPFRCQLCLASFARSGHFNDHMRSHTGEKPFECSECKRTFRSSSSLKVHKRCHSGVKPFACKVCGNCYTQKHSLMIHMMKKHPDTLLLGK